MTQSIFKYSVPFDRVNMIRMPKGAKVLSARNQREQLVVYALIDEQAEPEQRFIYIYGTGHIFDAQTDLRFIDTVLFENGNLVFHIFEPVQ